MIAIVDIEDATIAVDESARPHIEGDLQTACDGILGWYVFCLECYYCSLGEFHTAMLWAMKARPVLARFET